MSDSKTNFTITAMFPVSPSMVYETWLSSEGHTQMTGGDANCSDQAGEDFDAWDGYISGTNLELVPGKKIVQSWRTTEFSENDQDSKIEITLEEIPEGCSFTLYHSNIPVGQPDYEQGWEDHYLIPMREYFTA